MESGKQAPLVNERNETRINFLKKDKDQLEKRLEDVEERLANIKIVIHSLLSCNSQRIDESQKGTIIDYMIEEKNYLSKRINEIQTENEEAKQKSTEQRQKIREIINREASIEAEFSEKIEAMLKESKDKEDSILKLSKKNERINKEFKELAKNRLNSSVNPKEIPDLIEAKKQAMCRVLSKISEHSKYLENDIAFIEKHIAKNFEELTKINSHAKFPFKINKSLDDLIKPSVYNIVQGDIRAKVEAPPRDLASLFSFNRIKHKNKKHQFKLEEKFIKIESLCNELKTAEVINHTLKEDRNYLLSNASYYTQRKGAKQTTYKITFQDSFCKVHKRVVSNPLDYCSKEPEETPEVPIAEQNVDTDLDFSKDINNYSSVEENYYEGPGDSIIEEILDI